MQKINSKKSIRLFVTGFCMGTADLIPGVSGGTIAFLAGIYQELLYSIKLLSDDFLKLIIKGKIKKAFEIIPFGFLVPLMIGIFTAIFSLAKLLSYLLSEYSTFVWAFFFGLVLSSVWIVLKRVGKWMPLHYGLFVVSAIAMFFIVGIIPFETPNTLPFIFISGMLAICAMILPGISGSFILLLLGKYSQILAAVNNRDFTTLFTFMAGAVVGLALFSRVLTWLFKNYHDISVVILAGIMLGSVRKLWPFQEVVATRINSHGEEVPLVVKNVMPTSLDAQTVIAIMLVFIGIGLVLLLDRFQNFKEQKEFIK